MVNNDQPTEWTSNRLVSEVQTKGEHTDIRQAIQKTATKSEKARK
jgi:hypothetical protein